MGTLATRDWYERDGKRVNMKNGRSGIAEAMQTSPASKNTPAEVIHWAGDIRQLQVATGPSGGKHSVIRSAALNVRMQGAGKGDSTSTLRGLITGERYSNGDVDRTNPAIHRLVWSDFVADVTQANVAYPIVTAVNTALGTFGARRFSVRSSGRQAVVKTIFRGNASGRYVYTDGEAYEGAQEYLCYHNAGPGESVMRGLHGTGFGRGIVQAVLRTTENNWYTPEPEDGNSLEVRDITAKDCGASGSSAVSVTGWADRITIGGLYVDSHWNTAAISLRYDKKQADLDKPSDPKKANVIGPGKLLGAEGHAHGSVVLDLEDSFIRTGVDIPGQKSKSSRPAIMVDSCAELLILSNDATSVSAGNGNNRALHLEHSGKGDIRTVGGTKVGTRGIGSFKTSGNFSGWRGAYRNGQPFSADEYLSTR